MALPERREDDDWDSSWKSRPLDEQEKRRRWKDDIRRQLAEDRRMFAGYFRPNLDLRTITGGKALREIQTFVRDFLNLAHWNLPTDNASIKRTLCNAVADGTLIPVINYEYTGLPRVAQPDPAPLHWQTTGGGGGYGYQPKVLTGAEFLALKQANGELPEVGSLAGAVISPMPDLGAPATADDGFGLLGVVESAAGMLLGGGDDDSDSGTDTDSSLFSDDSSDSSTPLGNAQPFEYAEDSSASGDVQNIAARGVSAAEEAECDAIYENEMMQCQAAGAMFQDPRTYALCSQRAFSNYQACRGY